MAASPNLPPWFETARIAAKCTQAAPAMARLLTMRPSVLNSCQIARIERFTASEAGPQFFGRVLGPWVPASAGTNRDWFNGGANLDSSRARRSADHGTDASASPAHQPLDHAHWKL